MGLLIGVVAGTVLLCGCVGTSYVIAARLTLHAPASVRWCGAAIVAAWLLVGSFTLLASLFAFRLWVTVLMWIAAAVVASAMPSSDNLWVLLRGDAERLRLLLGRLWRTDLRWLLLPAGLLMSAALLRGLVSPPLAWDALTYHLVKAGRWVQHGGWAPEIAPDAWGYYEYFPYVGDTFWAWAMLPVHGDALLAPAGLLVWVVCVLATYTAARQLGADETHAVLAALTVGLAPAVAKFVTAAYVDNTVLMFFLLGLIFLNRVWTGASEAEAVLAMAALGLAAGVKLTATSTLILAFIVVVISLLRLPLGWRKRQVTIAACLIAAILGMQPYVRAWVQTGSPLYPVPLILAGRQILPGNDEFGIVHGAALIDLSHYSARHFLRALFFPDPSYMGFGPAAPVIMLLGIGSAVRLLRRPVTRAPATFLLAGAVLFASSLLAGSMVALATKWAEASARFVAPAFASMVILASVGATRASNIVWLTALVTSLLLDVPLGWSTVDVRGVLELVLLLLPVALVVWLHRLLPPRARPAVSTALAVGLVIAISLGLSAIRQGSRYDVYAAADDERSFDLHPIKYVSSWPIWMAVDDGVAHRLAVTAGWDGTGHNWYRYPLLGSRLQNEVLYVPFTQDGSPVDYRLGAAAASRMEYEPWVVRLRERAVDVVVALPPLPPEADWMQQHPETFEPMICVEHRSGCAYRFKPALPLLGAPAAPRGNPSD